MISGIHSATVAVADQDAALKFYTETLGWSVAIDNTLSADMRFVSVKPTEGSTQLALARESWFTDKRPGKVGISLTTHDIDATYATLSQRGVRFNEPVAMMPWGQKATWFLDPDDNEFFLVEE